MTSVVAQTLLPAPDPAAVLSVFETHLKEDHEIDLSRRNDGTQFFEEADFRVEFCVRATGLFISVAAANDTVLLFFKEQIVHHVAHLDPKLAEDLRWEGELSKPGDLPANFAKLTVIRTSEIFPGMQRITLTYPGIAKAQSSGIHFRLMMPLEPGRAPVWPVMGANGSPVWPQGNDTLHARYVTIKEVRADVEEVDVDIVRHAGGLISEWAQHAQPGDQVGAMGPAGTTALPAVDTYFLAADGTGMPAIARLLPGLPKDATGHLVVAAPPETDLPGYFPATGLEVHQIAPEVFDAFVTEQAPKLATEQTGYALFLGEFAAAQTLRKHFKGTLGLDKDHQISVAYWRQGNPGFGS